MKRILGMMVVALSVTMVACQKAPESARIGSSTARANGLSPGAQTTPSGITLNGIVTTDPQYQSQFEQAVKDFLEAQIDPDYVGTVSCQGANSTGVFVGGKIELSSGQALPVNNLNSLGRVSVNTNSELLIAVYDKFQDQTNLGPIPPTWLKQVSGYVQGNQVYLDFYDKYGHVTLEGTFDKNDAVLQFRYNTLLTYDGQQGYQGIMGDLHIPTCQFFRCQ